MPTDWTCCRPGCRSARNFICWWTQPKNQPGKPPASRLAHDTLAPLVRQRFEESDAPGQRGGASWRAGRWIGKMVEAGVPLDEADLRLVEAGAEGMRDWSEVESRLVDASRKTRRQRQRNRRLLQATGLTALILIVTLAGIAVWRWQVADQQFRIALARQLAALAGIEIGDQGLLLSLEATRILDPKRDVR